MATTSALEQGREAFSNKRWVDAYALLGSVDFDELDFADIAMLGRSAAMLGDDAGSFAALEGGYRRCLEADYDLGACQTAFWHGYRLLALGEFARGGAWLSRA